jgi:signal transduction histidine kinase
VSSVTTSVPKVPLRLLVVEDSEDDFELLQRELRKGGYALTSERVVSAEGLASALERPWDLMVTDWIMPGFSGKAVLETVAARKLATPCIVVSGTPNEEVAVQALRLGALDFLSKDKPRRLVPAVQRALREAADHRARVAAEQELKLSEERYRKGFEVAPEALLTFDLESRTIVDANGNAQRLFERSVEQLRVSNLAELSPSLQPDGKPSLEAAQDVITRALTGDTAPFDWQFLIGGELVPTEIQIVPLPTQNGNLARIGITDLRERIRHEEIKQRSAELELQNRRIKEANRLKSEFLANMSHELRTPLNAIIGFAELLYDGQVEPSSPQHQEFLGDILSSGRHLLQLINDVLDLAKVEAGKMEFRPEPVDLGRLFNEVTAILRTSAAQKQIRLELDLDRSMTGIELDPSRLKQVAYNYLSNAIKFTPVGGRVIARIRPEGRDELRFEVEDNGPGIAQADLARLFSEFQQLESGANKRHQGTGLGLALTRRLVEAQGGSVGVRSTVGYGTIFHATLPRKASRLGVATISVPRTTTRNGARTVLVVEDDVRDQAQLVQTLAGAGYSVELASTGQEALRHLKERTFDAVTIDLLLPDMNGLDLLAAIAETKRTAPIIVVTVVPDAKVVAGFAVHDILGKPVDRESLLASLARAGVLGMKQEGV